MIDLRSDTVTQPTDSMRQAIASAPVGDDVYDEDPTIRQLELRTAALLGKEDAVFVPSGTMANQIMIRVLTRPGDTMLSAIDSHIYRHENGAANTLGGIIVRELPGSDGKFDSAAVAAAIPARSGSMPASMFEPVTLLTVENTHNGAGGSIWPLEQLNDVCETAAESGLGLHLDGARLWNACAATGISEADYAAGFDTVSVCFSKGLGAPMGSALAGSTPLIREARRFKKMYGGGIRQGGMMAAGALHALDHHKGLLVQDHARARRLAEGLDQIDGVELDLDSVVTNMIYFQVRGRSSEDVVSQWMRHGVAALAITPTQIRAVTHLDIGDADIDTAIKAAETALHQ